MTTMIERPSVDMTGREWDNVEWAADDTPLFKRRPHGEHEHKCGYCRGEWDCDHTLNRDGTCAAYEREHGGHCSEECQRQTNQGRTWRTERIKVAVHRGKRTAKRAA